MKKMLSLGDSIAFGYKDDLVVFLRDDFEVSVKEGSDEAAKDLNIPVGSNAGDSRMLKDYLEHENAKGALSYDYAMFNCGLHDIKADTETGIRQVAIGDYVKNLHRILDLMQENHVRALFVTTTPIVDKIHNRPTHLASNKIKRSREDVIAYNAVAVQIMKERKVPIIDLFSFTDKLGDAAFCDHAHFTPEVRKLQAAYLAGAVLAHTSRNCDPS